MEETLHNNASQNPRLGVVLIHHRMANHLRGCLEALKADQTPWPMVATVAHVRTAEDSGEWIANEFPWVRLVMAERFGIAHLRNLGLKAVDDARHALILDVDARVRPGALEALVDFAEATPKAAVTGPRTLRPGGTLEFNAKRFYDWPTLVARRSPLGRLWPRNPWSARHLMLDQDHSQSFPCDWVAGAGMLLRGEALAEVGLFDEAFTFGFEDVDWCFRAKLAGWEIHYCPTATIVHHVQRRSARGPNRLMLEHFKSLWRFWRKHGRLNQR